MYRVYLPVYLLGLHGKIYAKYMIEYLQLKEKLKIAHICRNTSSYTANPILWV
jgi:hypothetical protein